MALENASEPCDWSVEYKVVVIGRAASGKTCLVQAFLDKEVPKHHLTTIGVEFHQGRIELADGTVVALQLWDTAGQERYRAITLNYFRGAHAALVVFDLTDMESFDSVVYWLQQLQQAVGDTAHIALVGNKADVATGGQRAIRSSAAQLFAEDHDLPYYEVSALTGEGIDVLLAEFTQQLHLRHVPEQPDAQDARDRVAIRPGASGIEALMPGLGGAFQDCGC